MEKEAISHPSILRYAKRSGILGLLEKMYDYNNLDGFVKIGVLNALMDYFGTKGHPKIRCIEREKIEQILIDGL